MKKDLQILQFQSGLFQNRVRRDASHSLCSGNFDLYGAQERRVCLRKLFSAFDHVLQIQLDGLFCHCASLFRIFAIGNTTGKRWHGNGITAL